MMNKCRSILLQINFLRSSTSPLTVIQKDKTDHGNINKNNKTRTPKCCKKPSTVNDKNPKT